MNCKSWFQSKQHLPAGALGLLFVFSLGLSHAQITLLEVVLCLHYLDFGFDDLCASAGKLSVKGARETVKPVRPRR
jgi:hypothetical protein